MVSGDSDVHTDVMFDTPDMYATATPSAASAPTFTTPVPAEKSQFGLAGAALD